MDISDIRLVIQWRASCTLSTIWQRWGRAVRNRGMQGTAILFAEKEYFDDAREMKRSHQEAQKRKAKSTRTIQTPAMKHRLCGSSSSVMAVPVVDEEVMGHTNSNDEAESGGEENNLLLPRINLEAGDETWSVGEKELREMMKPNVEEGGRRVRQGHRRELDPAMDCLINAHHRPGFQCRRKVFNIYFDNASSSEFGITYCYSFDKCDFSLPQGLITVCVMPQMKTAVSAVLLFPLRSAVTYTTQKPPPSSTSALYHSRKPQHALASRNLAWARKNLNCQKHWRTGESARCWKFMGKHISLTSGQRSSCPMMYLIALLIVHISSR